MLQHSKVRLKNSEVTLKADKHDDVIKWKHFPRNWPFVREIHRSPVNFPHKGQWRGALMFSLNYAWINDWVNNREAGDLRRQHGHYDVIVMYDVILATKAAPRDAKLLFRRKAVMIPFERCDESTMIHVPFERCDESTIPTVTRGHLKFHGENLISYFVTHNQIW